MVSYTINAFERSAYGSNQVPRYCVWVIGWESPSPHSNKMENKVKCTTRMSFSQPPWACTSTIRWKKDGIQPWRRRASHTFPRPSIVVSHGVIIPTSDVGRVCIPPGSHTEAGILAWRRSGTWLQQAASSFGRRHDNAGAWILISCPRLSKKR
jgi:hypothetical protein